MGTRLNRSMTQCITRRPRVATEHGGDPVLPWIMAEMAGTPSSLLEFSKGGSNSGPGRGKVPPGPGYSGAF